MKSKSRLPDFLIIGGAKCGSSSLFHYLSSHPELQPAKQKEPEYFTKHWHKGERWYRSLFPKGGGLKFEGSTSYTSYPRFPETPERIFKILPDARLVYIVRDPIRRIQSHLHHKILMGRMDPDEKIDSDFWMRDGHLFLNPSKYYLQITRYLPYFDLSRIHILTLESLRSTPAETMQDVSKFLGVDSSFYQEWEPEKRSNVSSRRRRNEPGLLQKVIRVANRNGLLKDVYKANTRRIERPQLSEDSVEFLWSELAADHEEFEKLTGLKTGYRPA